jgi:ribosome production factor 2
VFCAQAMLKKPEVKQLSRKNDIRPFEDTSSLEFLCERNECAAFIYATHNKKRPHNLVLVRRTEREARGGRRRSGQ